MIATLTEITREQFDVDIELYYATAHNVTGKSIYHNSRCYLRQEAADCLNSAISHAADLGLKLKLWDAFRPVEAQRVLWNAFPGSDYVSDPDTGRCPHCRGVALDLTLVDRASGTELDMGTGFDDFEEAAWHLNESVSVEARKNRLLLAGLMHTAGFEKFDYEWWHYQLPDCERFPILTDQEAGTQLMPTQ